MLHHVFMCNIHRYLHIIYYNSWSRYLQHKKIVRDSLPPPPSPPKKHIKILIAELRIVLKLHIMCKSTV